MEQVPKSTFRMFTHFKSNLAHHDAIRKSSHFSNFAGKSLVKSASPLPVLVLPPLGLKVEALISQEPELNSSKHYFSFASLD